MPRGLGRKKGKLGKGELFITTVAGIFASYIHRQLKSEPRKGRPFPRTVYQVILLATAAPQLPADMPGAGGCP